MWIVICKFQLYEILRFKKLKELSHIAVSGVLFEIGIDGGFLLEIRHIQVGDVAPQQILGRVALNADADTGLHQLFVVLHIVAENGDIGRKAGSAAGIDQDLVDVTAFSQGNEYSRTHTERNP